MDSTALTVIGILIGILLFGIKTGIGCGFSNITTREILTIGGSYFILAILFGSVADRISLDALGGVSSIGMGVHILVSLLLIITGIYTQKKWIRERMFPDTHSLFYPCPALSALGHLPCPVYFWLPLLKSAD